MTNRILVTGAAGAVGYALCNALLERGLRVRALVRATNQRSEELAARGAEIAVGDLLDLAAVHRAVEGCDRIYFGMSVSPSYLEAAVNMAAVAKHHKVEAFVNISQMTVSQMSITSTTDSPQQKLHWLAEQALNWSGLPIVHIRPTAFLDTFFLRLSVQSIRQHQQIRLPFGNGKISPIASEDVARVIAAVLQEPSDHIGKVYELTGARSQDLSDIAGEFSKALGQTISYVDVPWEPWRKALGDSGMLTPHVLAHLATMALLIQQNRYDRMTTDVELLSKRPPLTVFEFVQQHAQTYLANA
ncbi:MULTISPECIES: NAD(P)H-binding protein [Agrobacterium]|uniref:NAD-dependent epimerase/dehydratase family protein n=1 Tax=Agrobacterium tumefaciens TaxID=358 RepID=A0AAE6BI08_AGRTU|nr:MULTISPECIES: NAD(P)H-binding protein [Agrobacterium]QCL77315.1 NAD-dependent epimerase/dehydratase family protein [Agrobacterium tumefaciens]QCL82822.1 NAD-dependent epimerase/dehydratase family protein [Agrobacterium tumefaciens]WCK05814.1 NAD(P)H-binding protein [Agrobacterium tumefaciens]CUX71853.1 NmrA family protein [Agrobacterium sp. NCPPB 925]